MFGFHDRSQFDVYCYALSGDDQSVWRRRINDDVEHFKDVSTLLSADLAKLIHADGIHILINLNGYTKGARNEVFALQVPALTPFPIGVTRLACARARGVCRCVGCGLLGHAHVAGVTVVVVFVRVCL